VTIPATYASPIPVPASGPGAPAESVTIPASTGAQHALAAPEKTPWKRTSEVASTPTPAVIGTRTTAMPAAKTKVSGTSRHRWLRTAAAR
jgi:hypothetical protein